MRTPPRPKCYPRNRHFAENEGAVPIGPFSSLLVNFIVNHIHKVPRRVAATAVVVSRAKSQPFQSWSCSAITSSKLPNRCIFRPLNAARRSRPHDPRWRESGKSECYEPSKYLSVATRGRG